jgi:hypothetical protein
VRIVGSNSDRAVPCIPYYVQQTVTYRIIETWRWFIQLSSCCFLITQSSSLQLARFPSSPFPLSLPLVPFHLEFLIILLPSTHSSHFSTRTVVSFKRLKLHSTECKRLPLWRQHAHTTGALRICSPILGATLAVEGFEITALADELQVEARNKLTTYFLIKVFMTI